MMLFLSIFTSVFGFSMGLAQNYATYATCFVLYSVGTVGQYIVPYTYVSEISDKKRRGNLLFLVSLLGVFGDITISLIAALTRHWRYIAIYCGVINLFYLPIHFFISESPRWLLSVGKEKQACEIVKRYYKSKNLPFKMEKWNEVLTSIKNKQQKEKKRKTYSVVDLYKLPRVRIITLNVMFTWFVISLVYYGLVLNIGNLAGDPYVNGIVNSSLDIIATIFGLVAAKYVSKTYIISGSFISAGIACLGSMLVLQYGYPTVSMVLACVGRFAAASVYKIVYVLTPELFPTLLLGTGIGIGSGTSRIGGMLSPLIVQAQETYPWIMQTIFGTLGILAGFASLIYPDTKNVALPSTPEESEVFFQNNMAPLFKRRSKRIRGRLTRSHVDDGVL